MESIQNIELFLTKYKSPIKSDVIIQSTKFLREYDYQVNQLIGAGAFGVVMLAHKIQDNAKVAIKLTIAKGEEKIEGGINEVQLIKQIKSPFVVNFVDQLFDIKNKCFFIITEFCCNGDLHQFRKSNDISKKQIIDLFSGILQGIIAIHQKKIIHGDLKPHNILLDNTFSPKICDLGLSIKITSNMDHLSNKGGSYAYEAIEHVRGVQLFESDYYSAGAILCFLCGLKFEDDTEISTDMKSGKFEDVKGHQFEDLLQLAFSMMKTDAKERQSPQKVLEALQSLKKHRDSSEKTLIQQPNKNQSNNIVKQYSHGKYEGQFKDGKFNGYGTFTWNNGNQYVGDWIDDKKQGKGVYYYCNKNKYEGDFKNDEQNGYGTFTWNNRDKYEGDWIDGKQSGKGIFHFCNKNKYEGDFKDDKFNGCGTFTWNNGDKYEGDYIDGKQSGKGIFYFCNKNKYEGDFKDGKFNGCGTFTWNNMNKYVGDWIDGKRSGKGIFYSLNKDKYEGDFEDDQFNGFGTFIYNNGSQYVGCWKDNLLHGKGQMIDANGIIKQQGLWEKNIYVS